MSAVTASQRVEWIDLARGLALAGVVFVHAQGQFAHHVASSSLVTAVNDGLDGFRMPVLFAISGILTAPILERPWPSILRRRVLPLAYLAQAWAILLVAAFLLVPVLYTWKPYVRWETLWSGTPFGPVWYLVALAIYVAIQRVLRRVPWPLLAVPAAALSVWAVESRLAHGVWDHVFQHWIYFVLAVGLARELRHIGDAATPWRAAGLGAAFAALAYAAVRTGLIENGAALLALGCVGIVTGVTVAGAAYTRWFATPFALIGRYSLGVYLTHQLTLAAIVGFAAHELADATGLLVALGVPLAAAAVAATLGVLAGKYVTLRGVFSPPWGIAPGAGDRPAKQRIEPASEPAPRQTQPEVDRNARLRRPEPDDGGHA